MAQYDYSVDPDPEKTSKAYGRELHISPKDSVEICNHIRGMKLDKAKNTLQKTIEKEQPIPYRKHNSNKGHRKGLQGWDAGGYPEKAASGILKILENAESNAEYKGLDTEKLKIKHITANRGRQLPGMMPRAFGRATPSNTSTTNIEVVLEEQ